MAEGKATSEVQVDNARLRVTAWHFLPGAATGHHRHEYDYVVVPIVDGELELVGPEGHRSRAQLQRGRSYFRNAGVEHDVINAGMDVMAFVEIEIKG
jgi:beta-alanine degradation protein BauB